MDKRTLLFSTAAVALMAVVLANPAFAQADSAGETALSTLIDVITGSIGTLLGLGITILGLWTWIIGQKTGAGIIMIIGGVALTMAPSIFTGAQEMVGGVVEQFSGGDSSMGTGAAGSSGGH